MPTVNQGWAYVSSSTAGGTPAGEDTNIQFNNNGAFSGSNLLITDGSGSLSASVNISASAFYGDGTNLTGLTASAVNVADGPEQAIQFRVDTPVSGEISGSSALMFMTASNTLSGTYAAFTAVTASTIVGGSPLILSASSTTFTGSVIFSGNVDMCNATASIAHLSGCSPIALHASFEPAAGIPLTTGNTTIGTTCSEVVTVVSQFTASCGISASTAVLHPTSGTLAGAGSYLGLDANNRVVITGSDTGVPSPGGSTTQVQFNDAGAFQGDSGLVYNKTTDTLTAVTITASSGINPLGAGVKSIQIGAPAGPTSTRSIVIGDNAAAVSSGDIAIGANTRASKGTGIIVGQESVITGSGAAGSSIVIGYNSTVSSSASAAHAIVIGSLARATAANTIALGSGSLNPTANSMTIGNSVQGMNFNVTGNITLLNNGDTSYGHLNVCQGTASIAHLSGCSPIQVHAPMSSSYNISASAFYGNGAGLTGISLINLDAAGSDTNIQFNQNGEFAGNAGLAYNGTGSLAVSASAWGAEPIVYAGFLPGTASYGGRITIDGPSSSAPAYLGTSNTYVSHSEMGNLNFNYLDIVNNAGLIGLSASADIEFLNGTAATANFLRVSTNMVEYTLNTASLGGEDLEYAWSINSDHTGEEDESAWVKLDLDGGEFVVGGADNVKLIANAGLQVDNAASTFNSPSTFNAQTNLNADVTASAVMLSTVAPSAGPGLWVSSSNPALGGGNESYAGIWLGSGSMGGGGFSGAAIGLSNFYGGETLLSVRSNAGNLMLQSDAGDTTVKATDGEVILSGSTRVISHTDHNFQGLATFNAGVSVNNTALTINSSLQNNGISTFNDTATFNNSASVHNQGITVNNAAATFNSSLVANGDVTLGDASGDGVTWNAGSWNMSANSVVTTLKDGVDGTGGPGKNGAWMIMTGSGGDFMRFHTSGSAKGIYFPQQTYLSKGGSLSGTLAGPGSFLAIDSDNKVILATPSGGGGGGIFTETNGSHAYSTSSISVGNTIAGNGTLFVSGSGGAAGTPLFRVAGDDSVNLLVVTGSGRVGVGVGVPKATLHVSSSNNEVAFRVDNLQSAASGPALFVTGARGDGAAVQCLGIGTETPQQALDVNGYITLGASGGGYVMVNGDDNTWIRFGHAGADSMQFNAGGVNFLEFDENGLDHVLVNSASADVNFHVRSAANSASLFVEGDTGNVGLGTSSPKTALDVHYTGSGNPINLSNDTGGGEVVYFGTSSAGLSTGAVYFLNKQGGWQSVDSATTGSGHNQLLGIALGTKAAAHGVLVRGYFDVNTYYSGSFVKGGPMYIQSSSVGRTATGGGYLSGAAPSAADSYVRVVGYGTDTANVIYFNPDSTYVELA